MRLRFAFLLTLLVGCAYPRRETHTVPVPQSAVAPEDLPKDLWSLRVMGAELPVRKAAGLSWDRDGTGPDPFVRVYLDGTLVWESEVVQDTHRPVWNAALPRNLRVGSEARLHFEVWDWDSAVSADPMGAAKSVGLPRKATPNARARLTLDNLATLIIQAAPPRPHQGVGLSVEIHRDALLVVSVLPHSPAGRAGIRPGQRVVAVGGTPVAKLSSAEAFSRLSLAADRGHSLTVAAEGGPPRHITLDRKPLWLVM